MSIAGVRLWRWMELPITCGRCVFRTNDITQWLVFAILSLSAIGCSSHQLGDREGKLAGERVRVGTLVREREEQLTAMRMELASLRIASAKKDAEVEELRGQVGKFERQQAEARKSIAELRQSADTARGELAAMRTERDQLVQTKNELQAQAAELPLLRQRVADVKSEESGVQSQFKELRDTVNSLAAQLNQVKQEQVKQEQATQALPTLSTKPSGQKSRRKTASASQPLIPADTTVAPIPPPSDQTITANLVPSSGTVKLSVDGPPTLPPKYVLVRPGDTVTSLAQASGVSPDNLKRVNHLTDERLLVGQVLVVPKETTP